MQIRGYRVRADRENIKLAGILTASLAATLSVLYGTGYVAHDLFGMVLYRVPGEGPVEPPALYFALGLQVIILTAVLIISTSSVIYHIARWLLIVEEAEQ